VRRSDVQLPSREQSSIPKRKLNPAEPPEKTICENTDQEQSAAASAETSGVMNAILAKGVI
jgi:hypothetical protein